MASILTIDYDTPNLIFDTVYTLSVGEVFKYTKNVESLVLKIQERLPNTLTTFKVIPVHAGSPLFTTYQHNTLVVVEKV